MNRDEKISQYLANKHRGGQSNQKGSLYEDFFSVYQIVTCLDSCKGNTDAVSFQSQLEGDTFVDDFCVSFPDKNVYHQLKNTRSLSWGDLNQMGSLAFDFDRQVSVCINQGESFALKLVCSDHDTMLKLNSSIPHQVINHTSVEWFPYCDGLNSLVLSCADFKLSLQNLAVDEDKNNDDVLANIATLVLGVWKNSPKHTQVTLKYLLDEMMKVKSVNIKRYASAGVANECIRILDSIEGLSYRIEGCKLYWSFGFFSGSLPWSADVERTIVESKPLTKSDFINLF